jgi:hypothetical protein
LRHILLLVLVVPGCDRQPRDSRTILPGLGLKDCRIGAPIQAARDVFGKPSSEEGGYLQFADMGVEASTKDGKIETLFFHFRSRTHKAYPGKTDKGIGPESTIEEVINQYGDPDRIGQSTVSEFGPEPGAKEHYLPYGKLGLAFTFYDKRLANVRVSAKE